MGQWMVDGGYCSFISCYHIQYVIQSYLIVGEIGSNASICQPTTDFTTAVMVNHLLELGTAAKKNAADVVVKSVLFFS